MVEKKSGELVKKLTDGHNALPELEREQHKQRHIRSSIRGQSLSSKRYQFKMLNSYKMFMFSRKNHIFFLTKSRGKKTTKEI